MRHNTFLFLFILCIFSAPLKSYGAEINLDILKNQMQDLQRMVETLKSTVESQHEVIQKQGFQIQALEKGGGLLSLPTTGAPQGAPKISGLSQGFNPDIGLTGTIEAKSTQSKKDENGNDTIALKELELNVSQYVDPFSRLDAIISFNDALESQNVNIEEAYYTHWGLPLGFVGEIGKFRAKIGKENLLHSHQLDTTDYPLVIRNFFGDEGLASSGARLQNMIPNPWDIPVEVTGEILRGNNGNSFSGVSRRPIFNTHLKTFFQTSDNTNLELGGTALFGDENPAVNTFNPADGTTSTRIPEAGQNKYGVKAYGADATWNWLLPEEKKVKWQSEMYFENRATNTRHNNQNPWGLYSLLDYRFSKRFSAGARLDFLEPLDANGHQTVGISPYFTFWQSEFADFRLQYSYTRPNDGTEKPNNEVFLKANVLIGAHKHPVQ